MADAIPSQPAPPEPDDESGDLMDIAMKNTDPPLEPPPAPAGVESTPEDRAKV